MLLSNPLVGKALCTATLKSTCLIHSPLQPDTQLGHVPKMFTRQATSRRSAVSTLRASEITTSREPSGNAALDPEDEKAEGPKVVLNGSDKNGRVLQGQDAIFENSKQWHDTAFPSYLQSKKDDFCLNWEDAMQDAERKQSAQGTVRPSAVTSSNPVWQAIRKEAVRDAEKEPLLSSFMYASILSHDNFLECLAFVLANRMSNPTMLATEYYECFLNVFNESDEIIQAALDDLQAVRERDPACGSYSNAVLFYKGYQAIQVHRIANRLWNMGQQISARALQSRVSEVFSMDIHPQAKFGKGILMDHGTGIVIGQTAEIGNNVSILQNVTLGGTGKGDGDRHPKISDNVLIGAAATILGNITIGKGAMVAAGSLVLKPVPRNTMVAGSPAKEIGCITGNPALKMQHWLKDISSSSDPLSETFENMLRKSSVKQPDNKPVAVTLARKEAREAADRPTSQSAAVGSGHSADMPSHTSPAAERPSSVGADTPQPVTEASQSGAAAMQQNPPSTTSRNGTGKSRQQPTEAQQHLQQNASRKQERSQETVIAVKSDSKAHDLWPHPPEPEYYL